MGHHSLFKISKQITEREKVAKEENNINICFDLKLDKCLGLSSKSTNLYFWL